VTLPRHRSRAESSDPDESAYGCSSFPERPPQTAAFMHVTGMISPKALAKRQVRGAPQGRYGSAETAAGAAPLRGRPFQNGGSGMSRKILLVDEWRAVRLLGRRVLNSLGFQTREATNGREALQILAVESDILAVLLEWRPQDEDCLTLVRRLAGIPCASRPAVLACGDLLERRQIIAALDAGADEFLQKPFSRDTVREKFERLGIFESSHSRRSEMLSCVG
jgi:two-component system, chemotaxis family, chemotaxis protein CheY